MPSMDELRARYTRTETEIDDVGRQITIGLLKPAQRNRIFEMTNSSSGIVLLSMLRASTVREIIGVDGKKMLFAPPATRTDVDVILDVLDEEGMAAVTLALTRLDPPKSNGEPKDPVEETKN